MKQAYKEHLKNRKNIAVLEYIRLDIVMTVIWCYLERKNYKV